MRTTSLATSILALVALSLASGCRDEITGIRPNAANQALVSPYFTPYIPVSYLTTFVEITAGDNHTCARQYGGNLYCWGSNSLSQIGTGESDPLGQPTPTLCGGATKCVIAPTYIMGGVREVAAGDRHTCDINSSGAAYCWGYGWAVGTGIAPYKDEPLPAPVLGNLTFSKLAGGSQTTCGISSGNVYCWGEKLWKGSGSFYPGTTLVWGNGTTVDVAVGDVHACFLTDSGGVRQAHCWGWNQYGATGEDPALSQYTVLSTPFGSSVSRLVAARSTTCVDQQSGYVDCVGAGAGSYVAQRASQVQWINWYLGIIVPVQLHGVSTRSDRACALDANGAAYCWGGGSSIVSPVPGGHTFRAIAVGANHACAIGTDNIIYCWGDGSQGQLGTGLYSDQSSVPKPTAPLRAH
jgi:alpha-tubulin suppressor-like RCC1 family protein